MYHPAAGCEFVVFFLPIEPVLRVGLIRFHPGDDQHGGFQQGLGMGFVYPHAIQAAGSPTVRPWAALDRGGLQQGWIDVSWVFHPVIVPLVFILRIIDNPAAKELSN